MNGCTHLGAELPSVRREGRLEPSVVDLFDEFEVDGPRILGPSHLLKGTKRLRAASLDLVGGGERIFLELRGCVERPTHDALPPLVRGGLVRLEPGFYLRPGSSGKAHRATGRSLDQLRAQIEVEAAIGQRPRAPVGGDVLKDGAVDSHGLRVLAGSVGARGRAPYVTRNLRARQTSSQGKRRAQSRLMCL